MDELIVHVSEKTYAYGAIRAENQDLLSIISELKTRLEKVEKFSKYKINVESASKAKDKVVQIVLWVVDSGCSKHMTGDRSLLRNFIKKIRKNVRLWIDNLQQSQAMAIIYMAISLFVMYIMLKVLDIISLALDNIVMEI
ncbi:hypothetical protein Tco_0227174 [Tanacetum coccineum]